MSLAAKMRAFEKRLADMRLLARVRDAIKVSVIRDERLACMVTHIDEPGTKHHRVVCTSRKASDTDVSLSARHDADVSAAALGPKAELFM